MAPTPEARRFNTGAASGYPRGCEVHPRLCRLLNALAAVALAFVLTATPSVREAVAAPEGSRYSPEYFTNVPVVTHEGKTVRFYDDLIKGKKVVLNFVYLSCKDICPLSTSRMAQVRQRLGEEVGRDVFIYTITMDPEHDTPELLKEYADAFGGGGGWLFLTGKPEDINMLRYRLGDRSRRLSEHRNDLVLGNDATGDWSRSSIYSDFDVTVANIHELDPVYLATQHTVTSQVAENSQLRLDQQPGQALFAKACATCHTIGGGDLVGPDIKHIEQRRDRSWLTRFLKAPEKMRAEKDPIMLEVSKQYPAVMMPNLGLMDDDVADLLQYIEARSIARDAKAANVETASRIPGGDR
jgi:protein SCO1/2